MRVEISIKVDEKVSPDGFTGGIIEPENPLPESDWVLRFKEKKEKEGWVFAKDKPGSINTEIPVAKIDREEEGD
jgi:hypothetical protein